MGCGVHVAEKDRAQIGARIGNHVKPMNTEKSTRAFGLRKDMARGVYAQAHRDSSAKEPHAPRSDYIRVGQRICKRKRRPRTTSQEQDLHGEV